MWLRLKVFQILWIVCFSTKCWKIITFSICQSYLKRRWWKQKMLKKLLLPEGWPKLNMYYSYDMFKNTYQKVFKFDITKQDKWKTISKRPLEITWGKIQTCLCRIINRTLPLNECLWNINITNTNICNFCEKKIIL